jgi:hypothetical protein
VFGSVVTSLIEQFTQGGGAIHHEWTEAVKQIAIE